jgi:hypothetical protein
VRRGVMTAKKRKSTEKKLRLSRKTLKNLSTTGGDVRGGRAEISASCLECNLKSRRLQAVC